MTGHELVVFEQQERDMLAYAVEVRYATEYIDSPVPWPEVEILDSDAFVESVKHLEEVNPKLHSLVNDLYTHVSKLMETGELFRMSSNISDMGWPAYNFRRSSLDQIYLDLKKMDDLGGYASDFRGDYLPDSIKKLKLAGARALRTIGFYTPLVRHYVEVSEGLEV